jgi:hypothetical protein
MRSAQTISLAEMNTLITIKPESYKFFIAKYLPADPINVPAADETGCHLPK